ncbi:MAG: hypothetical protein IJ751_03595 [Oscillospiraceae bacterium]|nr:hypothetical protein [Oscillospiraceae bacterium]
MQDYQEPYLILLTSSTVALQELEAQNYGLAKEVLLRAQQQAKDALPFAPKGQVFPACQREPDDI